MRERIGEAFVEARLDTSRLGSDLSNVDRNISQKFQQVGQKLRTTGATLTRRLTLPAVALGAGILKTAGDFQKSMNMVQAVTGASADEFGKLEAQAKELGRTTQFSASQAADAMYFLASAGFDTNEVLGAMPGTLQLAAAAQMDLATAADIASNVLSGYGLEVEELSRVNDAMVRTFQLSNTNLQQLGEAMKYVGPVAKGAGLEFEDTAAAIGLMGNAGIQGSMAGTSLRGAITALLNPTGQAAEILNRLGINAVDAEGNLRPLDDIVRQLEDSGMSTAEMMQVFGQRAGPAMAALVEQGSDALAEMSSELRDAGGTAERVADAQMEGLNGAMARLKSAAEGVAIAVAQSGIIDWMANFADRIAGAFTRLAEANPELLKFGTIIVGAVALAGPVLWAVGAALSAIGLVLTPAGALLAGLGLLAGAFITAFGEGDSFGEKMLDAASKLRDFLAPAIDWVGDKVSGIGEFFGWARKSVADEVTEMSNETVGAVVEMASNITDSLAGLAIEGGTLSAELADELIGNVHRMRDEAVAAANEERDDRVAAARDMSDTLLSVSANMADGIIEEAERDRDESISAYEEKAAEVEARLQAFRDSGIEITRAMVDSIVADVEEQRDQVIVALTEQGRESALILERLRGESGQITAEMAAEAIQNSIVQRDETVTAAHQQYDDTVRWAIEQRDELGTLTDQQAERVIREARRQRDDSIGAAEEQHSGVVDEVSAMRTDVASEVNLLTGELLTSWDRFYADHMAGTVEWGKSFARWFHEQSMELRGIAVSLRDGIGDAIDAVWPRIARGAASGVNGLVGILNGFIRAVNRVASAVGLGDNLLTEFPTVSWGGSAPSGRNHSGSIPEFHQGGVVGRDGRESGGPLKPGERYIKALDGEEVLTADDPRHIGHMGSDVSRGEVGGWGRQIMSQVGRAFGVQPQAATDLRTAITGSVRPAVERLMGDIGGRSGWGVVGQSFGSASRMAGRGVLSWLTGIDAEAKKHEAPAGPGSASLGGSGSITGRLVQAFRASGIPGRFTSGFRPGDPGLHGQSRAADFAGPTPSATPTAAMGRIFDYFARYGELRELIYNGRDWNIIRGQQVPTSSLSPGLRRAHNNHVHVAMEQGGVITEPTLGLLGESSRAVPEIVTPQKLMAETFRKVYDEERPSGDVVFAVDGRELGRVSIAAINKVSREGHRIDARVVAR